MIELQKFLFEDMPVRGALVRLTEGWQDLLARRAANTETGAYPEPVTALLGEMLAAGVLMQSGLDFDGTLILQIAGDGPVPLAVAEVKGDLQFRATATVRGDIAADAGLAELVNQNDKGRCVITLDDARRLPGQQPYQGIVPLHDDDHQPLRKVGDAIAHYMLQSEQLDTTVVLAANGKVAAGLIVQRMPLAGEGNLGENQRNEDGIGRSEDFNRISILSGSLKREELLELDSDTILRRLFWQEQLQRLPLSARQVQGPRFRCSCGVQKVQTMLQGLGQEEVDSIVTERGAVDVACEFCGQQFHFDRIDAARLFAQPGAQPVVSDQLQ